MNTKNKTLVTVIILTIISLSLTTNVDAQSLLWKISGNGLEKPSYIYGTIHLVCPKDAKVSNAVKKVFDETEQLVLEIDMDEPDFMQKMQTLSVNKGMQNISSQLNENDRKIVNKFLTKHYGVDLSQLGIMKPFLLSSMIMAKTVDCQAPSSYENIFMAITKEQKEEVLGLERIEEQIAIFDNIPFNEQLEWLVQYTKEFDKTKEEMHKLINSYYKADLTSIYNIMTESHDYKNYIHELLTNRNEKWIEKIETYAKEKPTIFAVGAGHLAGNKGVIELLKEKNYTLTPVKQ